MALLCEMVVDLKSTVNSLQRSTEPEPAKESAALTESRRRSNRKGYRSKTQTPITAQSRDKKRQPSFLVDLKVILKLSFKNSLTCIPSQGGRSPPDA